MPIGGGPNNGNYAGVAQLPIVFNDSVIFGNGGGVHTSQTLKGDGLPGVNVWVFHVVGAGVVTVTVEFANGNGAGGLPNWRAIAPAFGAPLGVAGPPVNFRLGSRLWRLNLSSTGAAQVAYRMTCSFS